MESESSTPLVIGAGRWGGCSVLEPCWTEDVVSEDRYLTPFLDPETGKSKTNLDSILKAAARAAIDDIILLVPAKRREAFDTYIEKKQKRRKRLTIVEVPESRVDQAGLFDYLCTELGNTALYKGFIWIPAAVVPPRSFEPLIKLAKKALKQDSTASLMFWSRRYGPELAIGSTNHLAVVDDRTGELLGLSRYSKFDPSCLEADFVQKHFDYKGRMRDIGDSIRIEADLNLLDSLMWVGPSFLSTMRKNPDYRSVVDFVQGALEQEVKMNGVYICSTPIEDPPVERANKTADGPAKARSSLLPLMAFATPRQLWKLLGADSTVESDTIEFQGNKSYWRIVGSNTCIVHESSLKGAVITPTEGGGGSVLVESLILSNVEIGPTVTIKNSVISDNNRIGKGACLERIITPKDLVIPEGVKLHGPGWILPAAKVPASIEMGGFVQSPLDWTEEFVLLKMYDRLWLDLLPNSIYKDLILTPNVCHPDVLIDKIIDDDEQSSEDGDDDMEQKKRTDARNDLFIDEAQELMLSALNDDSSTGLEHIVLELRSLRLAEMKGDKDVLGAIVPAVCSYLFQHGRKTTDELCEAATNRGIVGIVSSFCSGPDSSSVIYDAVRRFITSKHLIHGTAENPACGDQNSFVGLLVVFDAVTENRINLEPWLRAQGDQDPILSSRIVQAYAQWIQEDESDDEDDDSDSD